MRTLKILLFPFITTIIYIVLLGAVFFGNSSIAELWTTIWLQIILLIFIFLSIQPLNQTTVKKITIITLILWVLTSLVALFSHSTQHAVFLICTHITLARLFKSRYFLIKSSKKWYIRRSAHRWLDSVSILLALTYTATIRVAWNTINLNCNDLRNQTIGFLTQYVPGIDKAWRVYTIAEKIDNIGNQNIGEILGTQEQLKIIEWNTFSGDSLTWVVDWSPWLLLSILNYQEQAINGIINNQDLIDTQVCDLTLQQVNNLTKNSDVQIVAFTLLTILISVFMRSIILVLWVINFILLWILFKTKRFTKKKRTDKSEDVYV